MIRNLTLAVKTRLVIGEAVFAAGLWRRESNELAARTPDGHLHLSLGRKGRNRHIVTSYLNHMDHVSDKKIHDLFVIR